MNISDFIQMKLLLVCTSGGHFSTMRSLQPFWSVHERVWVSDLKKDTEILEDKEKVNWLSYQAPRDLLALIVNIPKSLRIICREKPDIIISTGASLAINFALIAKLFGIKFIYIESISRAEELSLTGKIVYLLSSEFYVQWPELSEKYPKAIFKGYAA